MRRRSSANVVVTLTLLVIGAANGVCAASPYHWSAHLRRYGYEAAPFYSFDVAASDDVVAVDVGKILMFDAADGHLRATCDPWPGRDPWGIWSVAGGNFLAYFGRLAQDTKKEGPGLLLISPACEQLKKILLPGPSIRENATWSVLLSPTGKTLLISWQEKDARSYELRDAGTLRLRRQWIEPKSGSPVIAAVSDRGFLGMLPIRAPDGGVSPGFQDTFWYRAFDGGWRRLSVLGDTCAFLSDSKVVFAGDSNPYLWKVASTLVTVSALDGTGPITATVKGFWYHVYPLSYILPAGDGRHFGIIFDFTGAGPLWGNLDMGPERGKAYIWSAANPKPVVKFRMKGKVYTWSLALPHDGKWFAFLEGRKLAVRRLSR